MKIILIVFLAILLLFPGYLTAKTKQEHAKPQLETDLLEEGDQLSYEGQLKRAKGMLDIKEGQDGKAGEPSAAKVEEGWDGTSLMLGMVWGAIGTGFFLYGKKQTRVVFIICGIALMVFPMFVTNNMVSGVVGLVLTIAPFKVEF